MAVWPSTLPVPVVGGYQLAPVDQTVRSDMEVGTARTRRRTAARNDQVAVSWLMDDTQLATFRDWFDDAATGIAGGASWFNGLNIALGGGLTQPDCRFVGPFTAALVNGTMLWSVTAKLEVR